MVYTQEVLAVVLQQLVEQTPVPMLFMRTVLMNIIIMLIELIVIRSYKVWGCVLV